MNSDYIIKGKSQITLQSPDWAGLKAVSKAASGAAPSLAASQSAAAPQDVQDTPATQKTAYNATIRNSKKSFGPDVENADITFNDLIDTLNPLQHIPVVNMIYRNMTGDKISGIAQVAGSALYGGPLGIVSGVIDAIFEEEKGGSAGEVMVASLMGNDLKNPGKPDSAPASTKTEAPIMVADSATPVEAPAPVAVAQNTLPPVAEKQPFGGVMANNVANDVAENDDATNEVPALKPALKPAPMPSAAPANAPHKPVEVDGSKFYSLAGVVRHGGETHMPVPDSPDVRLKPFNLQSSHVAHAAMPAAENTAPQETAKQNEEQLLGLGAPSTPLASGPGFSALAPASPSGNPLPPQLIQDMMLMNMQKYQNGIKNGTLRGTAVDVEG